MVAPNSWSARLSCGVRTRWLLVRNDCGAGMSITGLEVHSATSDAFSADRSLLPLAMPAYGSALDIHGLAVDPQTRRMYAITADGSLYRFNQFSGETTLIGPSSRPR